MNTLLPSISNASPARFFCVWFICTTADELPNLSRELPHSQDLLVVRATCEQRATTIADRLIRTIHGGDFTITHVMAKSEHARVAYLLTQVEAGLIPRASPADVDIESWRLRYLEAEPPTVTGEAG